MRREEFLKRLELLLMDISEEERKEALRFYESYFEDAGEANEEKILKELESPQKVADTIKKELGENSGSGEQEEKRQEATINSDEEVIQKVDTENKKRKQENYTKFHRNISNGKQPDNSNGNYSSYDSSGNFSSSGSYDSNDNCQNHDGHSGYESYRDPYSGGYEDDAYGQDEIYEEEKKRQRMPIWAKALIIAAICVAGTLLVLFIMAVALGFGIAKNVTNKVTDKVLDRVLEYDDDAFLWEKEDTEEGAGAEENTEEGAGAEENTEEGAGAEEESAVVYGEYEDAVSVIDMDIKAGELIFKHSDTGKISYIISGISEDKIEVTMADNQFTLKDNRTRKEAVRMNGTIEVCLPEQQFEKIRIESDAALINIEDGMQAKNVEIVVAAGEISIDRIVAEELLTMNIGAGLGTIEEGVAGKLNVDCGTGQIIYEGVINGDADVICGVGEVDLELEGNEKAFNYELDCGLGCIESKNWTYTNLGNEQKIDNNADKTMKLDCGLGTIQIEYDDDEDHHS